MAEQMTSKMREAHDSVDERYRKYIVAIRGNPYITSAGRIAMAVDTGLRITVHPAEFFECADQLLCRVTVDVGEHSATAHARAFLGGTGPDETNPLENAETSAVARALGFLGFGLFGHGIASADEVQAAHTAQGAQDAQEATNAPNTTSPTAIASKAQINALLGLAERHNLVKRLDEALLKTGYDILRLPVPVYKRLLEKMHAVISGDEDSAPDYTEFERKAKLEAREARKAMGASDDEEKEDEQARVDREWHRQGRVGPPFPSDVAGDRAALKEMGLKDDPEEDAADEQFLLELAADDEPSDAEKRSEQMF